ncbi:hypothetical protein [Streptomyces sp. NBC_01803]|uniref:hypothetical protein n=1 Tax=Streptomyces sp. NBC_01803 TaxID=2975946 RepID=UPI002DD7AAF0|nr:hypothetical protein [Streptomyces sp. NBC_01803]WSA44555.1 hypothetical protein OIE51_10260 [Streptomyces sp. NBC_01803]
MDLISTNVATSGMRAASSAARVLASRYRPVGVPRIGSKEDRAEAYRLMLDASTRAWQTAYFVAAMRTQGRAAERFAVARLPQAFDAATELVCALGRVRLCGTVPVIHAAEELVKATSDLDMNARGAAFQEKSDVVVARHQAFVDACRADLAYRARKWWWPRKSKERQNRRQPAPEVAGSR